MLRIGVDSDRLIGSSVAAGAAMTLGRSSYVVEALRKSGPVSEMRPLTMNGVASVSIGMKFSGSEVDSIGVACESNWAIVFVFVSLKFC